MFVSNQISARSLLEFLNFVQLLISNLETHLIDSLARVKCHLKDYNEWLKSSNSTYSSIPYYMNLIKYI